jgi:hypothetical protein
MARLAIRSVDLRMSLSKLYDPFKAERTLEVAEMPLKDWQKQNKKLRTTLSNVKFFLVRRITQWPSALRRGSADDRLVGKSFPATGLDRPLGFHEGGKVVSPTHWPSLPPGRIPGTAYWDCGFESPPGAWMFVCCECCVWSGRGLCDGLITRPEEFYRLLSLCVIM